MSEVDRNVSRGLADAGQYRKDKEEFADTLDALFSEEADGKSDEELNKMLDDGKDQDPSKAGDATRDSDQDPSKQATSGLGDAGTPGEDPNGQATEPATNVNDSDVDWKQRALDAEAKIAKMDQKMKSWEGRIKAANKAKADAEAKLYAEEDASDAEKIAKFKREFPELGDIIDIQQKRIDRLQGNEPAVAQPDNTATQSNTSQNQATDVDGNTASNSSDDDAPTDHYTETRKAHPDLDEIVSQGVLLTWINKQPEYIQPHLQKVYQSGTVKQVVDMVTEFKTKTSWKSQLTSGKDKNKNDKLQSMQAVDSESAGPGDHINGPDKNDYDAAAKEAFK